MSYGGAWIPCEIEVEATIPVKIKMEPIELIREFSKAMKCEAVFDEDFEDKYNIVYDNFSQTFRVLYQGNSEVFDDRGSLYLALRDLLESL